MVGQAPDLVLARIRPEHTQARVCHGEIQETVRVIPFAARVLQEPAPMESGELADDAQVVLLREWLAALCGVLRVRGGGTPRALQALLCQLGLDPCLRPPALQAGDERGDLGWLNSLRQRV